MQIDDLVTYLIRHTGWSLEYIGELEIDTANALFQEIQWQQSLVDYDNASMFAMVIANWASAQTKNRRFKITDFIGDRPSRSQEVTMAKIIGPQKEVTITLADGKEYKLTKLTLNQGVEIEKRFGEPLNKVMEKGLSLELVHFIIYLMLKRTYPKMTEKSVGELITLDETISDVYSKVAELMGSANG
jgi:hypothetical protein